MSYAARPDVTLPKGHCFQLEGEAFRSEAVLPLVPRRRAAWGTQTLCVRNRRFQLLFIHYY